MPAPKTPKPQKPKSWYTLDEVADRLHISKQWARKLVEPYRRHCHLARAGARPHLVLWVPAAVLDELIRTREWYAAE